jgi:hypothetical protein
MSSTQPSSTQLIALVCHYVLYKFFQYNFGSSLPGNSAITPSSCMCTNSSMLACSYAHHPIPLHFGHCPLLQQAWRHQLPCHCSHYCHNLQSFHQLHHQHSSIVIIGFLLQSKGVVILQASGHKWWLLQGSGLSLQLHLAWVRLCICSS